MTTNPVKTKKPVKDKKIGSEENGIAAAEPKTRAKKSASTKANLETLLPELGLKEKPVKKEKSASSKKTISAENKKILKDMTKILQDKKCEDIKVINLEEVNSYLSIFVICTVKTSVQARAAARDLEKNLKHLKLGAGNTERTTKKESGWTLLDFGEIIVHIMTEETRKYYDLDRLWADGSAIEV